MTKYASLFLGLLLLCAGSSLADQTSTRPAEGLRQKTPQVFALTEARIVVSPSKVIGRGALVVRDGAIVAAGSQVDIPADARVLSMKGKTLYPGLIDAYSEVTVDTSSLENGSPHWNAQVTSQLRLADKYQADSDLNETLRGQGVTARLVAPDKGILRGSSVVVATGDDDNRNSILKADVAQHARLTIPRGDRDDYPNSPMGAVALARQTMYDTSWYARAWQAYQADSTLPCPERNDALAALASCASGKQLMIFDAPNELFVLRADRFAREFSLKAAIVGSGYEYRRLNAVRDTGRAVVVPLNFPKPPNVGTAEVALDVTLADMLHWDLAPENPGRLEKAGVKIALTSHGLSDRSSFLKVVRKAIDRGLSATAALQALTTTPAELLGVSDQLGSLETGKLANLVITDGDLFDENTKVLETWVLGQRYEIAKPPLFDLRGTWQVTVKSTKRKTVGLTIKLSGQTNDLSGTVRSSAVKASEKTEIKLSRTGLRDARFSCLFDGTKLGHAGLIRLSAVVSDSAWLGAWTLPDGSSAELTAKRVNGTVTKKKKAIPKTEAKPTQPAPASKKQASFAVNYPLGAFGVAGPLKQPKCVLFTNATIWTSGKQGKLESASLLIRNGKVAAVGKTLATPADAIVIDVAGKHISPGIIDCHSHMGTDGGVNESGQAVTAEVRIGDFIDANDITIYRHLAGGVTTSNILHGSANPIGGQNQVIKLRWGLLPEQLKFARAPQGVKFALGENVKQSNWGDEYTTRYPQTRMGVQQIMRDEFLAAREYKRRWEQWKRTHKGLPPRRDLELDAVVEILGGKRWVHCHSYRQDEILMLIRLLDDFGVTIGTFQHILEGYKVADAMAKHGAMGSAFSDWWAYKFEVFDAIPYNGSLMHNAGVVVSFNSDDRELARHLNQEAAKAVKYGGVPPREALKFVTLNPAKQLRIDRYVGSLEVGKDADLVVWSGSPLSNFSRCEQTWIDGRKYFDLQDDLKRRAETRKMRNTLIQKILASGEAMRKPGEGPIDPSTLWPREDTFCHHGHGHDHGHE